MTDSNEPRISRHSTSLLFHTILYGSFFLFLVYFWAIRYRDFLYVSQEYDLFLWRWSFLCEALSRLSGGSNWLSSFMIQFFYYPTFGAVILSGFGLIIALASSKLFDLHGRLLPLAFLPTLTLLPQITSVNYYLFERVDVAQTYSYVVNIAFMLVFALLLSRIRARAVRLISFAVCFLVSYPIFGFFALFAAFLFLLVELTRSTAGSAQETSSSVTQSSQATARVQSKNVQKRNESDRSKARDKSKKKEEEKKRVVKTEQQRRNEQTQIVTLAILCSPALFWLIYKDVVPNFNAMFTAGLWEESPLVAGRDPSTHFLMTLAVLGGLLLIAILAVVAALRRKIGRSRSTKQLSLSGQAIVFIIVASFCALTLKLSYYSSNFQTLLQVARALDREDWERVVQLEANVSAPINPLITARNLALSRLDRLADEIFLRPNSPKSSPQLETVSSFGMCGDRVLFESGLTNAAERVAFNNYVTKRERSRWALKTLALCALTDRRFPLAERYLYRLQGTLFDDGFVDVALAYLESESPRGLVFDQYLKSPGQISEAQVAEFRRKLDNLRKLAPDKDELASSETVNHALYGVIQNDNLARLNRNEQENRLAYLLLMRHLATFAKYADSYLELNNERPLPRYIQEALLFRADYPQYFHDSPDARWSTEDTSIFSDSIRQAYKEARTILDANSLTNEEKYRQMGQNFGDSFWFFYCFPDKISHY